MPKIRQTISISSRKTHIFNLKIYISSLKTYILRLEIQNKCCSNSLHKGNYERSKTHPQKNSEAAPKHPARFPKEAATMRVLTAQSGIAYLNALSLTFFI